MGERQRVGDLRRQVQPCRQRHVRAAERDGETAVGEPFHHQKHACAVLVDIHHIDDARMIEIERHAGLVQEALA